jgi:hypothetical protein
MAVTHPQVISKAKTDTKVQWTRSIEASILASWGVNYL